MGKTPTWTWKQKRESVSAGWELLATSGSTSGRKGLFPEPWKAQGSCQKLDLRLLAFRAWNEYTSVV